MKLNGKQILYSFASGLGWSWYHLSQEKLPHTILFILVTYCGKYAIPFFMGHPVYCQGRRQGVCLGRAKCVATAAPALKKSRGGGGGGESDTFFPTSKLVSQTCDNGVGVLSSWTWLTAEVTSKKTIENHGGGGGQLSPPPPPPWRRAYIVYCFVNVWWWGGGRSCLLCFWFSNDALKKQTKQKHWCNYSLARSQV